MKLSFDVQVISAQFHFTNGLFKETVNSSRLEIASKAKIIMTNEPERIWMKGVAIISHSSPFQNFPEMIQEYHKKSQTVLRVAKRCNYRLRSSRLWHRAVG